MDTILLRRFLGKKEGQALTEYAIVASIVTIGGIGAIFLFGSFLLGIFARLGAAIRDETVDNAESQSAFIYTIEQDAGVSRNMETFDDTTLDVTGPPPEPATPPIASDPLAYVATHHVGDNWVPGSAGGESLMVNEGLNYNINFILTEDMINYANYASGGTLYLTFDAGGAGNGFINDESVDTVLVNGQALGTAVNGHNVMTFDVNNASVGNQTLTFTSGMLATERDDYNFWNMMISYAPQ